MYPEQMWLLDQSLMSVDWKSRRDLERSYKERRYKQYCKHEELRQKIINRNCEIGGINHLHEVYRYRQIKANGEEDII